MGGEVCSTRIAGSSMKSGTLFCFWNSIIQAYLVLLPRYSAFRKLKVCNKPALSDDSWLF